MRPSLPFQSFRTRAAGNRNRDRTGTTTNLIGSMVRALYRYPEQLEKVLADRSLIPKLVEETLRFEPPIQFLFRRAREDVEVAGRTIPKDSAVVALIGSANRDERVFERPDEFDVTRDATGHLSFGFGNHFCLGASLARLEMRVIIESLIDELPGLQPAGDNRENVDSFMMRGPKALPLRRVA